MSSNASSQSTKHIGVVGGGLAGLTAAAAFITKGHRCTIFEKNKVILPNLNNGTRHIHPTINFWPLEPLAPATNFPFLNWHEGTPKNIEKQIQKDIDFLRTSPLLKIREQTKVTNFSVKQDANFRDADRISLFYQNNYDENNEKRKSKEVNVDCDILVISSGYSRSKSPVYDVDCSEYWENSLTNFDRDDIFNEKYRDIVISGAGDGALIEECQALYSNFDGGSIIPRFAEQIDAELYRTESVLKSDLLFADNALKARRHDLYHRYMTEIANALRPIYRNTFRPRSNADGSSRKVVMAILNDEEEIYQHKTAPIHRLIHYFSSQLDVTQTIITEESDDNEKFSERLEKRQIPLNETFIVSRLGPTYNVDTMLDEETSEYLRKKQEEYSDFILYNNRIRNFFLTRNQNDESEYYSTEYPEILSNKDRWIVFEDDDSDANKSLIQKYIPNIKMYFQERYEANFDTIATEWNEENPSVIVIVHFSHSIPAEWEQFAFRRGAMEMFGLQVSVSSRPQHYSVVERKELP